jgi:cellobiose epimerase
MTKTQDQVISDLKTKAVEELTGNILPFWMTRMIDNENGGFFGRIDGENNIVGDAPKGAILNARILWSFSAAYAELGGEEYLKTANRAKEYILDNFFDNTNGGTWWMLTSGGDPLDTKKQIYSQAFFIYALSEYALATGDEICKNKAIDLFHLIEKHSFDKEMNGYLEAFDSRWGVIDDLRLSEKDANEKKTMNTHLHVLEAYTNLYRLWPDEHLASQLENLIRIFLDKILDKGSSHLNLFFDENWQCKSTIVSYGHDIESSWLLLEAAMVLTDSDLRKEVAARSLKIVKAAIEGLQEDGSLIYEKDDSFDHIDMDRHWWVQAEAVVGFLNAWELTGGESYLQMTSKSFDFINNNLVDRINGEWYWSIRIDGTVNTRDDKAGFWKCPYHNTRMCLEIIRRIK